MPTDDTLLGLIRPSEPIELVPHLGYKGTTFRVVSVTPTEVGLRGKTGDQRTLRLPGGLDQCYGFRVPPPRPADFDVQEGGVLGCYDYRAGAKGLPAANRRAILLHVFEAPLADLLSRLPYEDTKRWGEGRSALRLERLANRLAQRITNESQQRSPAAKAIAEWKADRQWMRAGLYQAGHYTFTWPEPF